MLPDLIAFTKFGYLFIVLINDIASGFLLTAFNILVNTPLSNLFNFLIISFDAAVVNSPLVIYC